MRKVFLKQVVVFASVVSMAIILMSCCGYFKNRPGKPIPIKNAAVGLNFVTGGEVSFVDQEGKELPRADFKWHLDRISKKVSDWKMEKVQTINVYHIKGSHYLVFEIDGEGVCLEYSDAWEYKGPC